MKSHLERSSIEETQAIGGVNNTMNRLRSFLDAGNKNRYMYTLLIFVFIISILFAIKHMLSVDDVETAETYQNVESIHINSEKIYAQVKRSEMPDYGYRFTNVEHPRMISAFSTYYINKAKENADKDFSVNAESLSEFFLSVIETGPNDNLTDLYCQIMLIDNTNNISAKTKRRIAEYLDSLYAEGFGYLLYKDVKASLIGNIYSTHLVSSISKKLDIQIRPIEKYIIETLNELQKQENTVSRNSSAFVLILELLELNNIKKPDNLFTQAVSMFNNDISDLQRLSDEGSVYIPVYLMDYLDFCNKMDIESFAWHDEIKQYLCDYQGVKDGIIKDFDVFGLYAAMRTLNLINFDFNKNFSINREFQQFDSFIFDESLYISPGITKSSLFDTYYVTSLVNRMDNDSANKKKSLYNAEMYCKEHIDNILDKDPIEICYVVKMIRENNWPIVNKESNKQINDLLVLYLEELCDLNVCSTAALSHIFMLLDTLRDENNYEIPEQVMRKIELIVKSENEDAAAISNDLQGKTLFLINKANVYIC